MTAAKRFLPNYTIDDYLRWDGDWELWDGIAVSMSPSPFGRHQAVLTRLARFLGNDIESNQCDAVVLVETDWVVGEDTVVRPDVVVLCDGIPDRHIETTPSLVAEVLSDSTRQRDQTYKRDLYNEQGVDVYLLLDPATETLESYTRDESGAWQHQQVTDSIEISLCKDCKISVNRSVLFQS